jgi:hypothetical protein
MKLIKKLWARLEILTGSIKRFPLTTAFLAAAALFMTVEIASDKDMLKFILPCVIGAIACAAAKMIYERFFRGAFAYLALGVGGIALALLHYLLLSGLSELSTEMRVRTIVEIFALFFAFVWFPSIRSRVSFNESFMAAFKAFFQSLLFSGVLMGGVSAIIGATNRLIVPVNSDAYGYTATFVYILFAPVLFFSLIPVYPGKIDESLSPEAFTRREEELAKRTSVPKFLEVLLSYIVIPIASVFTVILLLYIIFNIRGEFWSDNLLEPMLISYSAAIILINLLVANLQNKFAAQFRRISPKVLAPIVLFQIAASLLILRGIGVTYGRYYVILYGAFAVCAGVVLSFLRVRKNGLIAAFLIVLSAVSLIPPVDAFTVSRASQMSRLESALLRNNMIKDGKLVANASIPEKDKSQIASAVRYLDMMQELKKLPYIPKEFNVYSNFYETFGFHEYDAPSVEYRYINVYLDQKVAIPVAGYDFFVQNYVMTPGSQNPPPASAFKKDGKDYTLSMKRNGKDFDIVLADGTGAELVKLGAGEIRARYGSYGSDKNALSLDEAAFTVENGPYTLTVVVQNAGISDSLTDNPSFNAQIYLLVKLG